MGVREVNIAKRIALFASASMRAWVYKSYGDISEVLELSDSLPEPVPGRGQLLVRMEAASINPVDWKIAQGNFRYIPALIGGPPFSVSPGTVPCSDGCGEVLAPGSPEFPPGSRVCFDTGARAGCLAQLVAVDASKATLAPASVPPAHAVAAVGLASGTAVTGARFLLSKARLEGPGCFVVLGAAGGVGSNAVLYLKALGHRVVATASERNASFVRSLGADQIIDYRKQVWHQVLEAASVHGVFQCVSSQGDCDNAARVLAPGCGFATCNAETSGNGLLSDAFHAVARKLTTPFPYLSFLNSPSSANLAETARLVDAGTYPAHLLVKTEIPFERAKEALELSKAGKAQGKIIVTF